jgi:hypothetical protein
MGQKEQIKSEYKGCVVSLTDPILGVRTIEVDRIKPEQIPQLKKYGFSFIFEVIQEPQPVGENEIIVKDFEHLDIQLDEYIYTDSPQVQKPKKPRKKRTNGKK